MNNPIVLPELIFGLVGPIGVDMDCVVESLVHELNAVGYESELIHLTELMERPLIRKKIDNSSYFKKYMTMIDYANEFRKKANNNSALAGLSIVKIRRLRADRGNKAEPALKLAYIVRQFKRPEEISLMRETYGRKFVQVSVYGSESDRKQVLIRKIKNYDHTPKIDAECEVEAIKLIATDANQGDQKNGQRVSDVFHLGDVFVNGIQIGEIKETINRFIRAFFGDNRISPTKSEYGLYIAAAASLRSVDLSRQVGAAIFSSRGEVIALGCNEVPKAGGGTYWTDDGTPTYRDIDLGLDANEGRKNEILFDLISRLNKNGLLSERLSKLASDQERVGAMLKNETVKASQVMDIIEFGRMIHAEMSAISDAARLGRATKDADLYCTTFPCHLCAKHIVAAGLRSVTFLEPYPKSYARKLHDDSITFDQEQGKVLFRPFIGISPKRYRDIFEKRQRKVGGKAIEWYEGQPSPLVEDKGPSYIENEEPNAVRALGEMY